MLTVMGRTAKRELKCSICKSVFSSFKNKKQFSSFTSKSPKHQCSLQESTGKIKKGTFRHCSHCEPGLDIQYWNVSFNLPLIVQGMRILCFSKLRQGSQITHDCFFLGLLYRKTLKYALFKFSVLSSLYFPSI